MMSVESSVQPDPFGARSNLATSKGETFAYYRLSALEDQGIASLSSLPFTIRILLENVLRNAGTEFVSNDVVERLAKWTPGALAADSSCRSCRPGWFCRISPACRRSSIWRRCARPSVVWAAM